MTNKTARRALKKNGGDEVLKSVNFVLAKPTPLITFRVVSISVILLVWGLCYLSHIFSPLRLFFGSVVPLCFLCYFIYIHTIRALDLEKKTKTHPDEDTFLNNPHPFVSLIIPARNEAKVLARLIQSLSEVDYPSEKYEVIVVNDNSEDKSEEVLEGLKKKYSFLKPVHRRVSGGGKSGSMNAGYSTVSPKAKIIGYLDADAVVDPSILNEVVREFARNHEVGAVQAPKAINASCCKGWMEKMQL